MFAWLQMIQGIGQVHLGKQAICLTLAAVLGDWAAVAAVVVQSSSPHVLMCLGCNGLHHWGDSHLASSVEALQAMLHIDLSCKQMDLLAVCLILST